MLGLFIWGYGIIVTICAGRRDDRANGAVRQWICAAAMVPSGSGAVTATPQ